MADARRTGLRRAALLLGAAGLVAAPFTRSLLVTAGALALWLVLLRLLAPRVLRRVLRPRLWLFSLLLATASGVLFGEPDADVLGLSVSTKGFLAGIWMVLRGVSLLTLASLAAAALTRSGTTAALARIGLSGVAEALRVATETLPAAQERVVAAWQAGKPEGRSPRALLRSFGTWFTAVVAAAAALAARPEPDAAPPPSGEEAP